MGEKLLLIIVLLVAADIICNHTHILSSNFITKPSGLQQNAIKQDVVEGTDSISTKNYANLKLNYYYYIPSYLLKNKIKPFRLIVAVPGLSGNGSEFVTPDFKTFAQKEGFGIVAPTFIEDAANWDSHTSYQYPAAWSGEAMLKILSDLTYKKKFNYSKLYLIGFSAGAQFTSRFSLLYPQLVAACSINASGGPAIPETNNGVKYFIAIGTQDEEIRKEVAQDFYNAAIRLNIHAEYRQYNEGHLLSTEQIMDSLNFFKRVKHGMV